MTDSATRKRVLARLASLRQNQYRGRRAPHKPLLVLLALGHLANNGTSELPWSQAETTLSDLIAEFGPPSKTGRAQSAAYPFTRLRNDGVWVLDQQVEDDRVGELSARDVVGRLEGELERSLRSDRELLHTAARALVETHFPATVAVDVLTAVGLDPDVVLGAPAAPAADATARRRDPAWRATVLQAWDRQCAFCGYDGQLGGATVGVEAAHVRWFAFGGPDSLDNGLALCVLHHKLFDLGALGLDDGLRVQVSTVFTARTVAGRALYDLHGRRLSPRPGSRVPAAEHVSWHRREVFKGQPLAA